MSGFPRQVAEHVTALGNIVFPTYLVRGDREALLVEAGISASAAQVLEQLDGLGVPRKEIHRLVITHAHFDHVVGAATLREAMPWLEILVPAKTAPAFELQSLLDVFVLNDAKAAKLLVPHGLALARQEAPRLTPELFTPELVPGEVLSVGGIGLEVLDASGHAPGGIVLFEPTGRIAFSSDSVGCQLGEGRFAANFFGGLEAYLKNLKALESLGPRLFCPGHGDTVGPGEVGAYVSACREEIDWVRRAVQARPDAADLPWDLFEAIYARHDKGLYTLFPEDVRRHCAEQLVWRVLDAAEAAR